MGFFSLIISISSQEPRADGMDDLEDLFDDPSASSPLPTYRPSLHYAMNSINLFLIASYINQDHTCSCVGGLGKA